jgi:hypothetical protein
MRQGAHMVFISHAPIQSKFKISWYACHKGTKTQRTYLLFFLSDPGALVAEEIISIFNLAQVLSAKNLIMPEAASSIIPAFHDSLYLFLSENSTFF